MHEVPIQRKGLWDSLGNVCFSDWKKAAEKLGYILTTPSTGTSHIAIRKPSNPTDYTTKSLVTTIYEGMSKSRQINAKVFREFLKQGVKEDDIWKALGKL